MDTHNSSDLKKKLSTEHFVEGNFRILIVIIRILNYSLISL